MILPLYSVECKQEGLPYILVQWVTWGSRENQEHIAAACETEEIPFFRWVSFRGTPHSPPVVILSGRPPV